MVATTPPRLKQQGMCHVVGNVSKLMGLVSLSVSLPPTRTHTLTHTYTNILTYTHTHNLIWLAAQLRPGLAIEWLVASHSFWPSVITPTPPSLAQKAKSQYDVVNGMVSIWTLLIWRIEGRKEGRKKGKCTWQSLLMAQIRPHYPCPRWSALAARKAEDWL